MAETNLGSELLEGGDIDGAIVHLEKSLRLKFDVPEPHNNLTYALFRKGDADAAIAEAHVALNFDPNNAVRMRCSHGTNDERPIRRSNRAAFQSG